MQNDARPLHMLQWAAAVADDSGQSRAVLGIYDHTNFLSHDHRLAWLTENVNPMNGSVHWPSLRPRPGLEAYDLLAPIHDWFTEGFDTKDVKEAKALFGELK